MSEVTESILFRQRLYENFKQSGMLSKLKTTLRTNLLQKLQKPKYDIQKNQQLQKLQKKKPLYLRDKFLTCIVKQYLSKSKKQYTLSILLPQSNMQQEDCLNYNQLAEITNLNQLQHQGVSFLEALVNQWTKFRAVDIRERSTQTDYSEPISKMLEDINNKYKPKLDYWKINPHPAKTRNEQDSSTSLISKQQKMRQQFQIQKKHLKRELELLVKAQIQKKYETQYQSRVRELQKLHEGRLTELKGREKTILDSLNRKTKQLEQKAKKINQQEMKMIKKYENRIIQLEIQHKNKIKELQNKEKEIWKKQLQLKSKKRQYQETIRLVKLKVVQETMNV